MAKAKRDKSVEFEEISKKIEEGELEVVHFNGVSDAWKIFNKIRLVKEPTKYVDYVRCKTCKQMRTYKPQNGPSSLTKHDCKKKNQSDEENMTFKDLSAEETIEIKNKLMVKSIELCATDILSPEIFSGSGFLKYSQYLVALGEKQGCVNLNGLLPNVSMVFRNIQTFKEEETQTIEKIFNESIKNRYCSLTMNSNTTIDGDMKLTVGIIYFNTDLTEITKKVIFTVSLDDSDEKTMFDVRNLLNTFGCDEKAFKALNVVTPKTEFFTKYIGQMCQRLDCVASIISAVLKPFADNKEIGRVIFTCRKIVSHLIETEQNSKLSFVLAADNGEWKSKVNMIKQLNEHYNEVMNLLGNEKQNEFKYNKKLAEESVTVLETFIEAIDSLKSPGPTSNKILPWWSVLQDHLNSSDKHSIEIKRSMKLARRLFEVEFIPTMEHKIACFLDPRYRLLKMISVDERNKVIVEVKQILEKMPNCASADLPSIPPVKKGKFSHLEADDDDVEDRDEVNKYIHSIELKTYNLSQSEFNIIGMFWKDNQAKLPKLSCLATTRLHIPACCCCCESSLNLMKTTNPEIVDNLLFLRDKLSNIRNTAE